MSRKPAKLTKKTLITSSISLKRPVASNSPSETTFGVKWMRYSDCARSICEMRVVLHLKRRRDYTSSGVVRDGFFKV